MKNYIENRNRDIMNETAIDNEMSKIYQADQNVYAGKWFFNSDKYIDTTKSYSNEILRINEQISSMQSARDSITGKMKSPEGQELEGDVTACFFTVINSAQRMSFGMSYILAWSYKRYNEGIVAGQISMQEVNKIEDSIGIEGRIHLSYWFVYA